jgi:heme exporter protein B
MRAILAIVAKDLASELRLKEVLPTMAVLAVVLVAVFGLAAGRELRASPRLGAAVLHLALVLPALLAVERVFAGEKESRTLAALLAAPVSRRGLFVAKCLSASVLVLVAQALVVPAAALFFEIELAGRPWHLAGLLLLGDAALVVLGTLASAMVVSARARGSLLAVLVLPLLVPVLAATAAAAAEVAGGAWTGRATHLAAVLAAFDAVFILAALLLAPHVIET